jgi:hypothetical protein
MTADRNPAAAVFSTPTEAVVIRPAVQIPMAGAAIPQEIQTPTAAAVQQAGRVAQPATPMEVAAARILMGAEAIRLAVQVPMAGAAVPREIQTQTATAVQQAGRVAQPATPTEVAAERIPVGVEAIQLAPIRMATVEIRPVVLTPAVAEVTRTTALILTVARAIPRAERTRATTRVALAIPTAEVRALARPEQKKAKLMAAT